MTTNPRTIFVVLALLPALACTTDLRDEEMYNGEAGFQIDSELELEDTVANRQLLDLIIQYRRAVVHKDVGALNRLVSDDYYDNAGSTDTTSDDFARSDLEGVFELLASHADEIKYDVVVKDIGVEGKRASIDYEFKYAYRFNVGEAENWDAGVDVNRLDLLERDGEWKIVSGL